MDMDKCIDNINEIIKVLEDIPEKMEESNRIHSVNNDREAIISNIVESIDRFPDFCILQDSMADMFNKLAEYLAAVLSKQLNYDDIKPETQDICNKHINNCLLYTSPSPRD